MAFIFIALKEQEQGREEERKRGWEKVIEHIVYLIAKKNVLCDTLIYLI